MEKIKIGITVGDINGIGLEVILKTLEDRRILNSCVPVIYGSPKVISYHKNIVKLNDFPMQVVANASEVGEGEIHVVNCWQDTVRITLGQLSEDGGRYALLSLEQACQDLQAGYLDALLTGPINKKAMSMAGFQYAGHTEYLTEKFGAEESLMLMVHEDLRIGLVTNHLPLAAVPQAITKERILKKIKILDQTLRMDFGIDKPKIAVLGLNPHAGDEGTIGKEELECIIPALEEAKQKGYLAIGPYPADGFFGSDNQQHFDAVLAMYHDQGLVPFKLQSFGSGVNYTAGLPIIRCSPDHGTAFGIVGQNVANHQSFQRALFLALDVVRQRARFQEMHANPLKKVSLNQKDDALQDEDELKKHRENRRKKGPREEKMPARNNSKETQEPELPEAEQATEEKD